MKHITAPAKQPGTPPTLRPPSEASARRLAEKKEIDRALTEAALTHGSNPDPPSAEDISRRIAASYLIVEIIDLVTELERSNQVIFYYYSEDSRGFAIPHPSNTMLGDRIINAIRGLNSHPYGILEGHRAHPLIEAFRVEAERRGLPDAFTEHRSPPVVERNRRIYLLNDFVACIREKAKSIEVRKQIHSHLRSSQKNEKGLSRYIDEVFLYHSRVMVLRIDLGYKKNYAEKFNATPYALLDEANSHRDKFLKHARETLLKDSWIGYAWKLEYGPDKRFHYHLLIFLNGARVRQDVSIARLIGEHWENEITKGNGVYFNCNAKKKKYTHLGIGVIDRTDQRAITELKTWVVSYLCKRDKYISLVLQGGRRTFGKAEKIKPRSCNVGRPRRTIVP